MKLFKPTATDAASLKLGRQKIRKYGFTADHVPYLTNFNHREIPLMITDPTTGTLTENPALRPLASSKPKAVKKTAPKKVPKKAAKPTAPVKAPKKAAAPSADGKTSLKAICQKLKLDPKAARVKLRRNADKLGFHNTTDRWMFTDIQAAKVEEILSTSK